MKLFVILFEQRSGSSHLVSLLNSHREIRARGEVFDGKKKLHGPNVNNRITAKPATVADYERRITIDGHSILDPEPKQCLAVIQDWITDPSAIFGFKFKFAKQVKLFPEVNRCLQELNDQIRVIVLKGDNLVRRALSHFNHQRLRLQTGKSNYRGNGKVMDPIQLDLDLFVKYVEHLASLRKQFFEWTATFSNTLHVEYEELISDSGAVDRIQQFIGVQQVRPLTSRVVKATSTRFDHAIENYDLFHNRMITEGFQEYLKRAA